MSKKLKLMPDYECYAIWDVDEVSNISASELPVSTELQARIGRWEQAYNQTLNQDNPSLSGFASKKDEERFEAEGLLIWQDLKFELGGNYKIMYFSIMSNSLIE